MHGRGVRGSSRFASARENPASPPPHHRDYNGRSVRHRPGNRHSQLVTPGGARHCPRTIDGRIEVGGVRLEDTPLWTREHTYPSAALPEVLALAGLTAEVIPLDLVRAGSEAVHARMEDRMVPSQ